MFLPVSFESENSVSELAPGVYESSCSAYQSLTDGLKAFIFEYKLRGALTFTICDLLIVDGAENLYFRDFMLMPDKTWRDSYGARSDSLDALFPPEVLEYKLIERVVLGFKNIGVAYV